LSDNRDLVRLLGTRFIQRRDVKAIQRPNGDWFPENSKFTMQDFEDHLAGKRTLGHYLLDEDNLCKLFAFDIDLVKHGQNCTGTGCKGCQVTFKGTTEKEVQFCALVRDCWISPEIDPDLKSTLTMHLRCMAEGLAVAIDRKLGIPVSILNSGGKGLHVYGFTGPIPAEIAREMALGILEYFGCFVPSRGNNFFKHIDAYPTLEIEVFPKQGTKEKSGYGNLMSLPLGINQRTGKPKYFVNCKSGHDSLPEQNPMLALNGHQPWE